MEGNPLPTALYVRDRAPAQAVASGINETSQVGLRELFLSSQALEIVAEARVDGFHGLDAKHGTGRVSKILSSEGRTRSENHTDTVVLSEGSCRIHSNNEGRSLNRAPPHHRATSRLLLGLG